MVDVVDNDFDQLACDRPVRVSELRLELDRVGGLSLASSGWGYGNGLGSTAPMFVFNQLHGYTTYREMAWNVKVYAAYEAEREIWIDMAR